ncbi:MULTISPECIES: XrtA system polysaccharide deacetylase [unclassified Novosphingobium]|uniref:XrtA system polysaccharide deacetylase n=1 Tax=unclassified Novosphingobium TaxID=2644732 RepID=UPI000A480923|nr:MULTISPECIES: XrtA system polysaccharide deacetylase [unclassified Novosphingobium]MDR6706506.1 polysaccharide deacetylase family protein (PEP-CTERM system associated) [Novosphingobium sp. 1748]
MVAEMPLVKGPAKTGLLNGFSVDVEDWFQVGAFEKVIDPADWDSLACRVDVNTNRLLDMCAELGVKATFFTLGWVAARHPALMRRIVEQGHELASHGWAHARVFSMDAAGFARDIGDARKALEDAGGARVIGYRAPSFSIDTRTPWAHEILGEQGYLYSSSVAPIAHDHYGWREAPRFAFRPVAGADLIEIPVTTVEAMGRRMAAGGGGFFRVLPYAFSQWAMRRVNIQDERPIIFYFHPWEVDTQQPRVAHAPLKSRLRHYTNIDGMEAKLRRMLKEFAWGRMDNVAATEVLRLVEFER